MEHKHEQIDLDTLAEVHRILANTEFASIEDVAARGGLTTGPRPVGAAAGSDGHADSSPLPRRR